MIRARCGNCVSEVQQENVAEVDPAHGELDDFVVPPTPDTGVDRLRPTPKSSSPTCCRLPFAPAALAWLAPGAALLAPDLGDDPVARSPFGGVPPVLLPGGYGDVIEDGGNPDDRPQPPALMPTFRLAHEPPSDTLTDRVSYALATGPTTTPAMYGHVRGPYHRPGATATPEPKSCGWLRVGLQVSRAESCAAARRAPGQG
jgi:hypothetical protein